MSLGSSSKSELGLCVNGLSDQTKASLFLLPFIYWFICLGGAGTQDFACAGQISAAPQSEGQEEQGAGERHACVGPAPSWGAPRRSLLVWGLLAPSGEQDWELLQRFKQDPGILRDDIMMFLPSRVEPELCIHEKPQNTWLTTASAEGRFQTFRHLVLKVCMCVQVNVYVHLCPGLCTGACMCLHARTGACVCSCV